MARPQTNDERYEAMHAAAIRVTGALDDLDALSAKVRSLVDDLEFAEAKSVADKIQEAFFAIVGDLEGIGDIESEMDPDE